MTYKFTLFTARKSLTKHVPREFTGTAEELKQEILTKLFQLNVLGQYILYADEDRDNFARMNNALVVNANIVLGGVVVIIQNPLNNLTLVFHYISKSIE